MAVVFNVLQRGSWRGTQTPIINKSYQYTITTVEGKPKPFQNVTRTTSEDHEESYSYTCSLGRYAENKIWFGEANRQHVISLQRDLKYFAHMPTGAQQPTSVKYGSGQLNVNVYCDDDNKSLPFTTNGSGWSQTSGIFFAFTDLNDEPIISNIPMDQRKWYGLSVAEKGSLPTLCKVYLGSNIISDICTKNIKFYSSQYENVTLRVYPTHVLNVNTEETFFFGGYDEDMEVRFVYIGIQAQGGHGGAAYWSPVTNVGYCGGGGASGAYALILCAVPINNGFISIEIPRSPFIEKPNNYPLQGDAVKVKYHDSRGRSLKTVLQVYGGGDGESHYTDDHISHGGTGGTITFSPLSNSTYAIIPQSLIKSINGCNGGNSWEGTPSLPRTTINKTLSTDTEIVFQEISGQPAWPYNKGAYLNSPGPGASSYFGPGADVQVPPSSITGHDASYHGSGGAGALDFVINASSRIPYPGGYGGHAVVTIGF